MRKFIIIFAIILGFQTLSAQSIDQSVEVNNAYIVQFDNIQRGNIQPTLVDSLYRFDYKFDYSVFDSPYKGAFDFSPYQVQLTPEPRRFVNNKFYLKAGAGLSLRPVLDLVYTPVAKKDFWLNISNIGRGYIGSYAATNNRASYSGYNVSDNLNIGLKWILPKHTIDGNLGLQTALAKSDSFSTTALTPYIQARLATIDAVNDFNYSINFKYRYMYQDYSDSEPYRYDHSEFSGAIIPIKSDPVGIQFDYLFSFTNNIKLAAVSPSIIFSKGIYNFKAGLYFDYSYQTNRVSKPAYILIPVVDIKANIVPNYLTAFLGVKGGQSIISQIDVTNAFPLYMTQFGNNLSKEKLHIFAGISGDAWNYFNYGVEAGARLRSDLPFEVDQNYIIREVNQVYAKANFSWHSERLDFDSIFEYSYTKLTAKSTESAYLPSAFRLKLDAKYNWLKRLYLGMHICSSSVRKDFNNIMAEVPGYVDLGLNAEYKFSSNMSAWMKSGNLLCQPIQEHIGFIQKSPYITVGISLVL